MMAKKSIRTAAFAALAFLCLPTDVSRGQSAADSSNLDQSSSSESVPCVLLRNDNVVFGRAHQVGQFVVIRSGDSGELQLPRQDVACWADSIRDLYRYRVDHRRGSGVSAHLRDARWCVQYDLLDLATVEVSAARALDPNNAEVHALEVQINRAVTPRPANLPVVNSRNSVDQVGHQGSGPDLGDIDIETLRFFAAHLQPMMVNRCGNCHAHDSGREFVLMVPGSGSRASSRMTQENLAASLAYVDRKSSQDSELLRKSLSPHGGSPAPLDPRHAKSIEALKIWLLSLERKGLAYERQPSAPFAQPTQFIEPTYIAERPANPQPSEMKSSAWQSESTPTIQTPVQILDTPQGPSRLPPVKDPFSPDLFNRRHHGDQ